MTLATITGWLNTTIWETSLSSMPRWQAWLIQMLRILIATARDIAGGLPTLRAMGLVYTTPVSYTHLTLPTMLAQCRSRWSPYH